MLCRFPSRAKLLATALYFHFNQKLFLEEGQLWAWPKLRTLVKESGQALNTVLLAIDDLEKVGFLVVIRQYNPAKRRHDNHRYRAALPRDLVQTGRTDLVQTGDTGLVQTGRTYSMNYSMNDSMNSIAPVADAPVAKGESEKKPPAPYRKSSSFVE